MGARILCGDAKLIGASLVAATLFSSLACAQDTGRQFDPPVKAVDEKGMDLVNGQVRLSIPLVSFGSGATALNSSLELSIPDQIIAADGVVRGSGYIRPIAGAKTSYINEFGPLTGASFLGGSGYFLTAANDYINPNGSRYSKSVGPNHMMMFTPPGGNASIYDSMGNRVVSYTALSTPVPTDQPLVFNDIELSSGERWRFYRDIVNIPVGSGLFSGESRIRFAISSRGYGIQFLYVSDTPPASMAASGNWRLLRKVTAYNRAITFCNEAMKLECPSVSSLPSAEISYNYTTKTVKVTDPGSSEGTELSISGASYTVRKSSAPGSAVTYVAAAANDGETSYVSSITDANGTYNYNYSVNIDDSGYVPYMGATSTNPLGGVKEVSGHTLFGQMTTYTDENLRNWWYHVSAHPGDYRVYGYTDPEQGGISLGRDNRNNITVAERVPKFGSGLSPVTIYSAVYPTHCENPRTCNKPTSETDARGAITNYTYDPAHGGLLTKMEPAPTAGSARPLTVRTYIQKYAHVKNAGGALVPETTPIWLPATETICQTTAGSSTPVCDSGAQQATTAYEYGADGTADSLLLRGVAVTAGGVTLRTCYSYDSLGRKISETQPAANLATCP